ncbi:hypothetical protein TIFTF001_030957 [Ficus carica]|uniref:Uncharacterized protein n=1 Tax=Ficus carica TaxID=3494 RepID=A0AA88DUE4_FICCA|nr:hypothetical protein TIFTF001_030957 [Ficus carica]
MISPTFSLIPATTVLPPSTLTHSPVDAAFPLFYSPAVVNAALPSLLFPPPPPPFLPIKAVTLLLLRKARSNSEYTSRGGRDGYRKLDQKLVEYNTQETQGKFESVDTNDVLTQALSKPEHPGLLSMRRKIEELNEMVRGLCAKKDMEPSVDQDNMLTVDQHNSFKASCTLHYKQLGVSDPPTMSVNSQEFKTDTPDAGLREQADALVAFLRNASKGRFYLVPHKRGRHWVLGDIDP